MKVKLNLALLLMLLLQTSYGQTEGTYQPASECSNYNAFLTNSTFDSLKYYTDTIYPSGIMRFDLSKSGEYGGVEGLHPLLGVEQGVTFGLINTVDSRFTVSIPPTTHCIGCRWELLLAPDQKYEKNERTRTKSQVDSPVEAL